METVKFDELQLDGRIICAITEMGFEEASPIQAQTIPVAMEGRNTIGQAQTDMSKTTAFGIPLLQEVNPKVKKFQAIILLPTRELAIQAAKEMCRLTKPMHGIEVLPIYGEQDIVKQIRSLKDGIQVVVGTPGRVMNHMCRKTVRMDHVHTVVLDGADEMLNMRFLEDMRIVLSQLPEGKQTLMFSAAMPQVIADTAKKLQDNSATIRVIKKELTVPRVTQYCYEMKPKNKMGVICRLLDIYAPKLSIIFCNTKRQMDDLVQALQGRGYFAEGPHGDLKQIQRDRVMDSFRNSHIKILVATDVAARGIDVGDMEAAFNYDVPQNDECYVRGIGRTGRAGRKGKASSLVVGKEVYKLRDTQRCCETKIVPQAIPSLNDITGIEAEKVLDQVMDILDDSDLAKMVNIIEKKLMEEDYTSLDLAAAPLKIDMGDDNEDVIDCTMPARSLGELDSFGRNAGRGRGREGGASFGGGRRGATDRAAVSYVLGDGDEKMARFFINIGKAQRVTPGDILGTVAGKSGTPGRMVGGIDIYNDCTFVDVPGQYADEVLKATSHAKIRGESVHVEKTSNRR